ncbi:MAG: sigma-70 family RNA polymerase sigma factor [Clostridia bacterium]|nr:sigma-70 family RNA polymerase sigma factor [Clostridia bacterium]
MDEYKPLTEGEVCELIKQAKGGDTEASEKLVNANFPLIKAVVKGYLNKGTDYEDLYQIGCVGFLKAIKNFNPSFDVKFSTYAVPMVAGEIKRFLRDDGMIKVSRSIKTLAIKIRSFIEEEKRIKGEGPTISEIAKHFGEEEDEIILALDSSRAPISLQAKLDEDDPSGQSFENKLVLPDKSDDIIDKIMLKDEIKKLDEKEKKLILLRFFRGKTQGEVAEIMNISQVQVSRLEAKIIEQLKSKLK